MRASLIAIGGRPPFEEVYQEFLPRITGFLRANLDNPSDADDLAAQVFARAFQAYDRFEQRCDTPGPWLFRIARNVAYDHHRRSALRQLAEKALAETCRTPEDPTLLTEQRFAYRQLRYAIARLPERQRKVLTLRHDGELSFKEVGDRLACSEDAAKMLYHRSLQAIRPLLTDGMAA